MSFNSRKISSRSGIPGGILHSYWLSSGFTFRDYFSNFPKIVGMKQTKTMLQHNKCAKLIML